MTSKTLIFALHGFLGVPKDFDLLDNALPRGMELVPVDYTLVPSLAPTVSLANWGANFNAWVAEYLRTRKDLEGVSLRRILLGYSQGGRLALHSLIENSAAWDLALIISANPGIPESEKKDRRNSDKNWALKFLSGDFKSVVKQWNDQAVFKGSEEPPRLPEDYRRELLAQSLERWSVSEQQDLRLAIEEIKIPVLWISGERDVKYTRIGEEMAALNANIQSVIVGNAGHRVLFDQPKVLAQFLK